MRFLRFRGSLWEAIWGKKSDFFSDAIFDYFLVNFWEGPADPPEPLKPEDQTGVAQGTSPVTRPVPLRGGGGS